ncbi:MAG: choice-of-anchor W domain-containing protein [Cyanobacteria bacterium P01_E01_bin.42]
MNGLKILGAIAGTTFLSAIAVLGATTGVARAFTLGGTLSEQEFENLGVEIPWAAESRIGISGAGDHEVNIHDTDNDADRVQAEYDWVNGESVDFALVFDSFANTLTYTVGGVVLEETRVVADNFSDLYIRTSARTDGSSILVDNLFLSDSSMSGNINAIADSSCSGGVGCGYYDSEYLHIGNIVGDFTLTGQSLMSWGETLPTRSRLAYQIKLVEGDRSNEEVEVPEPASISLLSLGLAGLFAAGKRRKAESDR